jgi:hypothetical protein
VQRTQLAGIRTQLVPKSAIPTAPLPTSTQAPTALILHRYIAQQPSSTSPLLTVANPPAAIAPAAAGLSPQTLGSLPPLRSGSGVTGSGSLMVPWPMPVPTARAQGLSGLADVIGASVQPHRPSPHTSSLGLLGIRQTSTQARLAPSLPLGRVSDLRNLRLNWVGAQTSRVLQCMVPCGYSA